MAKSGYKIICIGLLIVCLLQLQELNAQAVTQPTLSEFFDKLKTIAAVKENLRYDTFPDFDFTKFEPLQKSYGSRKASYVVGSTSEKKIRTIIFINTDGVIGTMSVYDFQSFRILTFKKREVILSEYPDFPIFCVSKDSRFIVYLNRPFEYQQRYKPEDIASIQILRDDLFPIRVLTIRSKYIRMLATVNYVNGGSRNIDNVSINIIFEAEKDGNLLVSDESQYAEDEFYIPAADFMTTLRPTIRSDGMPYWLYANSFEF